MEIHNTVLENGLDFILEAVKNLLSINEDAVDDRERKRLIKYALLHASSGIELVFKHKLLEEHWTYVFEDMNKANKAKLQSGDLKSAYSDTVRKRLNDFCDIELIKEENDNLDKLRKMRNSVEHFRIDENILSYEGIIHKSINALIRVIDTYYNRSKFTDEEGDLFSQIGFLLQKSKQHYDDALVIAKKELEHSGRKNEVFTCPHCEEEFLLIDDSEGVKCLFCGYETNGEEAARDYISNIIGLTEYESVKDGEEYPLYECPECENDTFVFEWADGMAICFSCGYYENASDFSFCSHCGKPYLITEDDASVCSACLDDILDEDDDD